MLVPMRICVGPFGLANVLPSPTTYVQPVGLMMFNDSISFHPVSLNWLYTDSRSQIKTEGELYIFMR